MKNLLLTVALIFAFNSNFFGQKVTELSNKNNFRIITGTINNQPIKFVFDTGANRTVLSPQAAKKLKLNLTGTETINTARGEVKAKSGSVQIDIDGHIATVDILVSDFATLHGVEAILGTDFLQNFDFLFDSKLNSVCFDCRKPADEPTASGKESDGRFQIIVKINDSSRLFLIDTGAANLTVFEKQGAVLMNANFNNFQNDVSKKIKIEIAGNKQTLDAFFLPPSGAQTAGLIPAKMFKKFYYEKTTGKFYLYL